MLLFANSQGSYHPLKRCHTERVRAPAPAAASSRTGLVDPFEPPTLLTDQDLQRWKGKRADTLHGARLWRHIPPCLILEYSHRCDETLAAILQELCAPAGLSTLLGKSSMLTSCRTPLLPQSAVIWSRPVCVLRHTVRARAAAQRLTAQARRAHRRVLLCRH